jgi:uridine kinase
MVTQYIERKLMEKSTHHRAALKRLEASTEGKELSRKVMVLPATRQVMGMNTILHDIDTSSEDFIFYFDRLAALLVEEYVSLLVHPDQPPPRGQLTNCQEP